MAAKISVTSTTGRSRGTLTVQEAAPGTPPALALVHRIGEGHSGLVFLARATEAAAGPAEVVVKVARREEGPDRLAKLAAEFTREQQASATFGRANPAFVRLFTAGDLQMGKHHMPALVMEKVPGAPLASHTTGGAKRSVEVALRLVSRLAEVLSDLERAGYRHNDLHTENLFTVDDDPATLRIIDLGRASKLSAPTKGSRIVFAAPERRAGGGTTGVASDIYTVGVVLYTLLSGTPPARPKVTPKRPTGLDAATIAKLLDGCAPMSAARREALSALLTRALRTAPAERHATFAELRAAVDAVLATP